MIYCGFSVGLWENVLGIIAGITLLILSCCCSILTYLSLGRLHNRQMTQTNNLPPARKPAPMTNPITVRGVNTVASTFFLVILSADVVVTVVLLVDVAVFLLAAVAVVLLIGVVVVLLVVVAVVLLVGVAVVLLAGVAVILLAGVAVVLLAGAAVVVLTLH